MKTTTKQTIKKILKVCLVVIAVAAVSIVSYRYFNRPVQVWNADAFEGRNPDKVDVKGQGQKYWQATAGGQGFYITDVSIDPGTTKTYCVSGGAGSDQVQFSFGGQSFSAKNGFFTKCVKTTPNDKQQVSFNVESGELQVYRVDRKR